MMWRNRFLTVLLAVPLLCAGLSCSEEVVAPEEAENSSGGHFDTRYIADDFVIAAVVHPSRVYQSKTVQDFLAEMQKENGKGDINAEVSKFVQHLGFDPRAVEQAILLVDGPTVAQYLRPLSQTRGGFEEWDERSDKTREIKPSAEKTFDEKTGKNETFDESTTSPVMFSTASTTVETTVQMQPFAELAAFPSLILRFKKAPDQSAILKRFARLLRVKEKREISKTGDDSPPPPPAAKFAERQHDGKTIHTLEPVSVCFPDKKTMLISTEALLERMLAVKESKSSLAKQLSHLGDRHDVLLAADVSSLTLLVTASLFENVRRGSPEAEAEWKEHLIQLKKINVTAGASSEKIVAVRVTMGNKTAAKKLTASLKKEYEEFSKMSNKMLARDTRTPKELQSLLKKLIGNGAIEQDGVDVLFGVARSADSSKLPQLLMHTVLQIRAAARRDQRKNNLQQIGLAFHDYHEIFNRILTVNKGGLSWRVHLLPMLDEHDLYEKFHLSEPWDSPHNKKLIQEMPDVFKNPAMKDNGKTSVHLFIGRQAIFFPGKRVTFGFITDGTSNTLMTVEAGPDKAEFWTKPGGLPFDIKKDPKAELGKIGELFLIGLADGSVHSVLSTIDSKILKALITRNGRERIDWDALDR